MLEEIAAMEAGRESESRGRMTKSEGKREMIRVAGGVECLEEGREGEDDASVTTELERMWKKISASRGRGDKITSLSAREAG